MLSSILNDINTSSHLLFILIRSIIIYMVAIWLFRIANTRFKLETALDYLLAIIGGSVLSRSMNGSASLISGLVAFGILVAAHWLLGYLAFKFSLIEKIVKGRPYILFRDGVINWHNMRKNQITREELYEECRRQLHCEDLIGVKEVRLGANGRLTFIKCS